MGKLSKMLEKLLKMSTNLICNRRSIKICLFDHKMCVCACVYKSSMSDSVKFLRMLFFSRFSSRKIIPTETIALDDDNIQE